MGQRPAPAPRLPAPDPHPTRRTPIPREEHTTRGRLRRTAVCCPANDAVVDE
jgi:hypothetical protein